MTASHLALAAAAGYIAGLIAAALAFFTYHRHPASMRERLLLAEQAWNEGFDEGAGSTEIDVDYAPNPYGGAS